MNYAPRNNYNRYPKPRPGSINKKKFNYRSDYSQGGNVSNRFKWDRDQSNRRNSGVHRKFGRRLNRSRSSSPPPDTEEYRLLKIQQTSELIKRQILSGGDDNSFFANDKCIDYNYTNLEDPNAESTPVNNYCEARIPHSVSEDLNYFQENDKRRKQVTPQKASEKFNRTPPSNVPYDVGEIHCKIVNHISKLNYGRKMNLINAATSGYDLAIQRIQKQKRLELSRALRAICSSEAETPETTQVINSIIPDFGIKLEDLPREVIEQLSCTLNFDQEEQESFDSFLTNEDFQKVNREISADTTFCDGLSTTTNIPLYSGNQSKELHHTNRHSNLIQEISDNSNECSRPSSSVHDTEDHNKLLTGNDDCILLEPKSPEVIEIADEDISESIPCKSEPMCDTSIHDNISNQPTIHCESLRDAENTNRSHQYYENVCLPQSHNIEKRFSCISTQTSFIAYNENPRDLTEAISTMFEIDLEIERLTRIRKQIFINLNRNQMQAINQDGNQYLAQVCKNINVSIPSTSSSSNRAAESQDSWEKETNLSSQICNIDCDNATAKRKRIDDNNEPANAEVLKIVSEETNGDQSHHNDTRLHERRDTSPKETHSADVAPHTGTPKQPKADNFCNLVLPEVNEKILVINVYGKRVVAGSETGTLHCFNATSGSRICKLSISHHAITCTFNHKTNNLLTLYIGVLDYHMYLYNFQTYRLIKTVPLKDKLQCMTQLWGCLFMGGQNGYLYRYKLKNGGSIVFEDQISTSNILVLKATMEGARKIILVATRNSPVTIRDAMTGLHMRTLDDIISPTVYSLVLKGGSIYCGTMSDNILVYSFHDGKLETKLTVTKAKGVGCMHLDGNILFASCHDGYIYIFHCKKNELLGTVKGPGGIILSMGVFRNCVIVGTIFAKFSALSIPTNISRWFGT